MSRIGLKGATQIYNVPLHRNEPPVGTGEYLEGYQLVSERPFTNQLRDSPFGIKWGVHNMSDYANDLYIIQKA